MHKERLHGSPFTMCKDYERNQIKSRVKNLDLFFFCKRLMLCMRQNSEIYLVSKTLFFTILSQNNVISNETNGKTGLKKTKLKKEHLQKNLRNLEF